MSPFAPSMSVPEAQLHVAIPNVIGNTLILRALGVHVSSRSQIGVEIWFKSVGGEDTIAPVIGFMNAGKWVSVLNKFS